jgi:cytochrome P450
LDVIGSAGFGIDFGALDDQNTRHHNAYEEVIRYIISPLRFAIPYFDHLPIGKVKRAGESAKVLKELLDKVIDEKKKNVGHHGSDILDRMIDTQTIDEDETKEDELDEVVDSYKHKKKETIHMSDSQLRHNLFLFFVAGHETSASALTWALYELSRNEDIQRKAREEVLKVVGSVNVPTWDDLAKLDYLTMVLKETLRLWTPVSGIMRVTNKQVTLCDYVVPEGTVVFIAISAIHYDEKIYPEPLKFDPERFNQENVGKRHVYAWLPFSAGPRSCIGNKFSLLEMKLTLAMILQKFSMEPDPTFKLVIDRNITIRPKDHLRVILKPL